MKMTVKKYLLIAGILLIAISPILSAQTSALKIGFANIDLIVASMPEMADLQTQLQAELQVKQQELEALAVKIRDKEETYQKQQALLTAETRQQRETELQGLYQEYQTRQAEAGQGLNQRQLELQQPLEEKVFAAINEVAAEQGLAYVLRQPALLYVDETQVTNITEAVARKLGLIVDDPQ